ncbi:MAG: acetyl-CoA synthase subunit delta [Candidatus Methanomethylicota archaeon]|uniref:Acetyl-CoA synthase subunit delta n=1 Tax=Thermoproteota archaeon TaxID=2056631 RepID=A0A497EU92_9CREN|nr:MAG: acetyl-CoA synthase subunit delta [Candidatus Verstraetearchaeota archaeon]
MRNMGREAKSLDWLLSYITSLLKSIEDSKEIIIEDLTLEVDNITIELPVASRAVEVEKEAVAIEEKPVKLIEATFNYPKLSYQGSIATVKIGATSSEGGSRKKTYTIGGAKAPQFYNFIAPQQHIPVIALDVFDVTPPLAGPVKEAYKDVLNDPVAWAEKCVKVYGADMISLHLVGTHPQNKDLPPSEARRVVESILQAVDVPLIIGGSGDPRKDMEVFAEIASATRGERLVFASITLDMDVEKAVKPIAENGHNAVALAFLDINQAEELCRKILQAGLPKDHLILDPTTGALGYGIEYSYSVFERIRLSALMGKEVLQVPMSCAATNAWVAREAWQKVAEWGPRELRGPLWEATTAIICMLAGAELFMMMHPLSAKIVKKYAQALSKPLKNPSMSYVDWVKSKF